MLIATLVSWSAMVVAVSAAFPREQNMAVVTPMRPIITARDQLGMVVHHGDLLCMRSRARKVQDRAMRICHKLVVGAQRHSQA